MAGITVDTSVNPGKFPQTLEPLPAGGVLKVWAGLVDLDANYPCGGYATTASLFGFTGVTAVIASPTSTGKPTAVTTAQKLRVFDSIGTEVVTANKDLSAETVSIVVFGF